MRKSKSQNQKAHAKRRANERYAINLHADAQERIVRDIQAGRGRCIRKQSLRVSIWEVEHQGQKLPVVYDKRRKTIITILPEEALVEPSKETKLCRTLD